MRNPFRFARRVTLAPGAVATLWPAAAGETLSVSQLTVSSAAAAELVVFFGSVAGDRLNDQAAIRGLFLGVNAGAAPDLACRPVSSPTAGASLSLYASAACDVWVAVEGEAES